MTYVS
ncbi:hypothetical protein F383_34106 [Gossypium arboreum]